MRLWGRRSKGNQTVGRRHGIADYARPIGHDLFELRRIREESLDDPLATNKWFYPGQHCEAINVPDTQWHRHDGDRLCIASNLLADLELRATIQREVGRELVAVPERLFRPTGFGDED